MKPLSIAAVACVALSACALKGDVRRVEREVQQLRTDMARADSARADFLDLTFQQLIALQRQLIDSLEALNRRHLQFRGSVLSDLTEVQRQLVQIQELTGQNQQRLSELRSRLQERESRPGVAAPGADSAAAPAAPAGMPTAAEMYDVGIQQLRRGSRQTARSAFQMLLDQYPNHARAPDAQFHIGESWTPGNPDSAAAAYERVVQRFGNSPRAPVALYRLGLLAEERGDSTAAQGYYQRVVAGYPSSDVAELARAKLNPDG